MRSVCWSWLLVSLAKSVFLRQFPANNRRIWGRRGQNSLASCVGCEEAPCPAESSGFKTVVVKNNLALRVGCEEAPCLAEYYGFKAVVVKNNLALHVGPDLGFIWPKFPELSRRCQEQPCPSCGSGSQLYLTELSVRNLTSWSRTALPFVWDCLEGLCPDETSKSKDHSRPKSPDLRPSWSEQPWPLCGMWRSCLSGQNLWIWGRED